MTTIEQEDSSRAQAARTLLRRHFGERVADLDRVSEEHVIAATTVIDLAAGETLVRKGDDADRLFLVQQGRLEAIIDRRDGGDQFLATIGPGDLIGEVALLAGGTRSVTVRAATPCRLTALARSAFEDLVTKYPEISAPFVSAIVERLRHSQITTYLTRLFGPMNAETVADMEREVRWCTLASGEVLCREGDRGDCALALAPPRRKSLSLTPRLKAGHRTARTHSHRESGVSGPGRRGRTRRRRPWSPESSRRSAGIGRPRGRHQHGGDHGGFRRDAFEL